MTPRLKRLGAALLLLSGCVSRTEVFEEKPVRNPPTSCSLGALECAFPELPELQGVVATARGDTAFVHFAGTAGARDYRIFAVANPEDVTVTPSGRVAVRNAVYRCAGDRQLESRPRQNSLDGDIVGLFTRDEADATLGHVFAEPGLDRVAILRLADPAADADASFETPATTATRAARYVPAGQVADALLAGGYRDDGIAFYAPLGETGTRPVFVWRSAPLDTGNRRATLYLTDGPERVALEGHALGESFAEEFRVLDAPTPESIPLARIFHQEGHAHDVLAAGDAERERLLAQGNAPLFDLAWPGLSQETLLVVEALDAGCPFPGHLVPDARLGTAGSGEVTLDAARLASGEVYVGGQHDATSRPAAIARTFVRIGPEPFESFDFAETFDDGALWSGGTAADGGAPLLAGDRFTLESSSAESHFAGALLGQLWAGLRDDGGAGWLRVDSTFDATLRAGSFLHVSLRMNLPSTPRRHPFLQLRVGARSIVVRSVGVEGGALAPAVELRLETCEGDFVPDAACAHTDLAGRRLADPDDVRPWAPVPVLAELSGFDLPVRLDVHASTERVYLFVEGRPAGCGILPVGLFGEDAVVVGFGSVSNDSRNDESTVDEASGHQYLLRHSPRREVRRFDDLGIAVGLEAPPWNETLFPCGTEWRIEL